MKNQPSQQPKLLIKLQTLMFTIEQESKQFSHYPPKKILDEYNQLIQQFGISQDTPKSLETNLSKLEEIKVIARFYSKDIYNNIVVYYKLNYPIETCYNKIKEYYG
ncbi:plasmid maintenance protein [Borreliella garinii]|uniref:plasmid maintenance protein n=1 Tax=Borreliella garinii TaxID=29519 RepID=UPI0004946601|nr:plasmid maintenance protein [Borreliella garinii]